MTITARRSIKMAILGSLLIWGVLDWEGGCDDPIHGGIGHRTAVTQTR